MRTTLPAIVSGSVDARPPDEAGAEVRPEGAAETELVGSSARLGLSGLETGCSPVERKCPSSFVNICMDASDIGQ